MTLIEGFIYGCMMLALLAAFGGLLWVIGQLYDVAVNVGILKPSMSSDIYEC